MNKFFLIRHGESQANIGLATTDPKDAALTLRGEMQAKQIAAYLKEHTALNLIVTSRFLRSKQTAEPTRRAFSSDFHSIPHEEWDVEEFTYLSPAFFGHSTVHDRRPLVDSYWEMLQPSFTDGKGSESFKAFIGRVRICIRLLQNMTTGNENIAVFSHELFITAVLWSLDRDINDITPDSMKEFRAFFNKNRIPNGAIVEVEFRRRVKIWKHNTIKEHLERPLPDSNPPPSQDKQLVSLPLVGQLTYMK